MLEDTYKMYAECADQIPDWRTADKNDLVNRYCDLEEGSPEASAYMAAIMCRYWPKIFKLLKATPYVCTAEDVYDWLTTAVLETVSGRIWRNPEHKMYGDPNAPDKIINRMLKTIRLNYLVFVNRKKRQINIDSLSLDELADNVGDNVNYSNEGINDNYILDTSFSQIEIKSILKYFIEKQKYYLFFIYYLISIEGVSNSQGKFSEAALTKSLSKIDSQDLTTIAEYSDIPYKDVLFAYSMSICGKTTEQLHNIVSQAMYQLKKLYYDGVL